MAVVYTDGACLVNGQKNARAAFGVFWGDNDKRNVSELLPENLPQTNGYAELGSVIKATEMAVNSHTDNITVKSDSVYVVNGGTKWIYGWVKHNWIKSNGSEVKHK